MAGEKRFETGQSLLVRTRKYLHRYQLAAKKSLGQNFLVNGAVLADIIAAAELESDDVVIEVGPGLGVLTREMTPYCRKLIAVEIDDGLSQLLRGELADFANVRIITQDVLTASPLELLVQAEEPPRHYKVVANLPYYITSAVLRHFLADGLKPQLMVVMLQKEVAKQIVAAPGKMSLLSVSVQLYGEPQIIAYVPARDFYPAPKVDSAILKIKLNGKSLIPAECEEGFFALVRGGFSTSRKQLVNSLANGLGVAKTTTNAWLKQAGISPERRAQTLSLAEWIKLWRVYEAEPHVET